MLVETEVMRILRVVNASASITPLVRVALLLGKRRKCTHVAYQFNVCTAVTTMKPSIRKEFARHGTFHGYRFLSLNSLLRDIVLMQ